PVNVGVRRQGTSWICRRLIGFFLEDLDLLRTVVIEHQEVSRCQVRGRFTHLVCGNHADLNEPRCGSNYPRRGLRVRHWLLASRQQTNGQKRYCREHWQSPRPQPNIRHPPSSHGQQILLCEGCKQNQE